MYFFFGQTETIHERTLGYFFFSSKLSIQLQCEDTLLKLLPIKKKATRMVSILLDRLKRPEHSATKSAFVGTENGLLGPSLYVLVRAFLN